MLRTRFKWKRKAAAVLAAALLFCGMAPFCVSAAAAETVEKETVRVGYYQADGYHEMNADGTRYGYGFDFLQTMLRYNDWQYEYVGFDRNWGDMLGMLDRGEVDVVTLANKTDERLALFDYTTKPIGASSTVMTVSSRNTKIISEDYGTYQNVKIGLVTGSSHNAAFEAYAKEKGFPYIPVYYDDIAELIADLRAERNIDVAVTSNMRVFEEETIIDEFNATDYYAIVKKGNEKLLNELNAGIAQMDIDTPDWRNILYQKYYANNKRDAIFLSVKEQAYLEQMQSADEPLTVAMNPELAPYAYFRDGKACGIAPEIFDVIAKKLGITYEILPSADRWEYKEQIRSGEAVVDLTAYLDYSIAQKYNLMETDAYLMTSLAMLYRTDSVLTREDITVAVVRENTEYAGYNTALLDGCATVEYESLQECVDAVKTGKTDAAYCYVYAAEQAVQQDYRGRLHTRILNDDSFGLCLGVNNKADHRLLSILNKGVNSISAEQRQSIMIAESTHVAARQSLASFLYTHPVEVICAAAVVLALLCLGVVLLNKNRAQKELLAAKSEFLARMSHDMRTPMNVILGLAAMTIDDAEDPVTVRENMTKMRTASDFLLSLVNDILDMTRMEEGKVRFHEEPYAYSDFVAIMKMMFQSECDRKNITLALQTPEKNPSVMTDRTRLNQIFFNLFSNAVKFTKPGGKISFTYHNCRTENGKFYCDYELRDTGVGMSEEFQKRLFEPFAQEDSRVTPELQGCGLGLSIAKRLIDLMGGTIRIESKKGEGTVVFVSMSYELITMDEQKRLAKDDAQMLYQRLRGRCVLLAEDHPLNAQIAKNILEKMGITVIHAENGKVALEKFKGSPENGIDAILMDIRMPEMNGLEATKAIRALRRPDAATVPIIALSANAYEVDVKQSLAAGMNEHLAKPIDPKTLNQTLTRYFEGTGDGPEKNRSNGWQAMPEPEKQDEETTDPLLLRLDEMGAEVEATLERLMGDEEMYLGYLRKLPEDKNMAELRAAVERGEDETAECAVHTLKGMALNLGLLPLADVCMDMLLAYRAGKPAEARAMLPAVEKCFAQWVKVISEEDGT